MGSRRRRPDMTDKWRTRAESECAAAEAGAVIARWNSTLATGRATLWSPTIRAAVLAGMPWLDVHCPGCKTSRTIDIRTIDRHPVASVGSLVLGLHCSWCGSSAPMPRLIGLHQLPPIAATRASEL